jgi:hypothetical protein
MIARLTISLLLFCAGCQAPSYRTANSGSADFRRQAELESLKLELAILQERASIFTNGFAQELPSASMQSLVRQVNLAKERAYPSRQRILDDMAEREILLRRCHALNVECKVYREILNQ